MNKIYQELFKIGAHFYTYWYVRY